VEVAAADYSEENMTLLTHLPSYFAILLNETKAEIGELSEKDYVIEIYKTNLEMDQAELATLEVDIPKLEEDNNITAVTLKNEMEDHQKKTNSFKLMTHVAYSKDENTDSNSDHVA